MNNNTEKKLIKININIDEFINERCRTGDLLKLPKNNSTYKKILEFGYLNYDNFRDDEKHFEKNKKNVNNNKYLKYTFRILFLLMLKEKLNLGKTLTKKIFDNHKIFTIPNTFNDADKNYTAYDTYLNVISNVNDLIKKGFMTNYKIHIIKIIKDIINTELFRMATMVRIEHISDDEMTDIQDMVENDSDDILGNIKYSKSKYNEYLEMFQDNFKRCEFMQKSFILHKHKIKTLNNKNIRKLINKYSKFN